MTRKSAYRADQSGWGNLKAHVPFVGMGPAGQKALKKLLEKNKKILS